MQQSTKTEILHILMTNLINICSFWEISIFEMTALILCTSNTMLDINRTYIGGERWLGIFCNHSTDVQSTASTEILQTFPMTNLINICSFWEYRYSPWRYCSRGNRILCWIEIGLKLVEKGGLEFPLQQHWSCSSPQQAPKMYTPSWLMTNSIFIYSFWEYRYSKWRQWSRVHRILCFIWIGLQLVETDGLEFLFLLHWLMISPQAQWIYTSWCLLWSIYVRSENIDIRNDSIDLFYIEYYVW